VELSDERDLNFSLFPKEQQFIITEKHYPIVFCTVIGRFYTKDTFNIRLDEVGQTFVVRLIIRLRSGIKTGTRHNMRLDELSLLVRLSKQISKRSWSRRITRLVPVFVLETNNQANYVRPDE